MNRRVFLAEMRKIWRPLPLIAALAVFVVGALFAANQTHLVEGPYRNVDVVVESAEFGPVYTPETRRAVQTELEKAKAAFAADMAADPAAREQGVTDWDSYHDWQDRMIAAGGDSSAIDAYALSSYERVNSLEFLLRYAETDGEQIRATLNDGVCFVRGFPQGAPCGDVPGAAARRIDQLVAQAGRRSLLGYGVISTIQESGGTMMVTAVLCAMLLTMFTMTRDRQLRLPSLQWASRTGRSVRSWQAAAVGCSAALAALTVGTVWAAWLAVRLRPVLGTGINTALATDMPWFDWTVLQYLVAYAAVAVLASLALSLVAAWIVRARQNYIRMLLVAIPVGVAAGCLVKFRIGAHLGYLANPLNRLLMVPGVETIALAAILVLAVALWTVDARLLRRRELPVA
ncbi:hypothetical protein [Bifidobacterium avesanii]|uniref:Uncharacterized protein n=1 Tax=Bifidobacterium avesanii TaxID=1798157 RepID=A0A7K3TEZ4_9BIFI|nr:hypothetical protein [Bifidobacterium avesanii]KAB8295598.1 hypothetical protein DSM100685_0208 [Bifidobacterium avesanii]NEG77602.1 hypothetical protein [Bifidobacterium avesanii]